MIKFLKRLKLNFIHLKERKFGHNFADTINLWVHFMFLFAWIWESFPFFLRCRKNTIYRTTLTNELSNVGNTITSLKQNDILHVILYGDKNFDNDNNQNMMGTKTLKAIEIKVYLPQPSNLSDTIVIRNGKIVSKHGPYCWYFRLNLKYLGWPYRGYMKTAENGVFCEGFFNQNDFEAALATFCCYD